MTITIRKGIIAQDSAIYVCSQFPAESFTWGSGSATLLGMTAEHTPDISVVILNWNRPDDTCKAVSSVLMQTGVSFEVLVWDNASSDDSRERLTDAFGDEPRVRLLWSETNDGVAGGRNRAFALARADLLLSLDSDAWFTDPGDLVRILQRFQAESDIGALSFEVVRPDGHLMWPFARPANPWRKRSFDTIRVDGCSFAFRRGLFQTVGGFAEHFSPYGAEDQYFAYQVIGQGFRVVYDPAVSVVHAFTPKGRQGRQFAMHVRNMLWMPMELFPFPHHLLRAGVQAVRLAREAREQGQLQAWREGVGEALSDYRRRRRRPLSAGAWNTLRQRIREDKAG